MNGEGHRCVGVCRVFGLAGIVATATILAGCGHASSKPAQPSRTSSIRHSAPPNSGAGEKSRPATETERSRAVSATPTPGTVLLDEVEPDGRVSVASNSDGFSVIDSMSDIATGDDASTIQTYDESGHPLATIPAGSFTGECGAADIDVPGRGRLIITTLVKTHPAEGVHAASKRTSISAWSADTGKKAWQIDADSTPDCDGALGVLEPLDISSDGSRAMWDSFAQIGEPINLRTGKTEYGATANGIMGKYFTLLQPYEPLSEHKDWHFSVRYPRKANGDGPYDGLKIHSDFEYGQVAANPSSGLFASNSDSDSPSVGTNTKGDIVFRLVGAYSGNRVRAYALPSGRRLWQTPRQYKTDLLGHGGGVVLIGESGGDNDGLFARDERTGDKLWRVPGKVCAITASEVLVAVNSQLATLDLRTGHQLSYDPAQADCPDDVRNTGIAVTEGNGRLRVIQMLTP